MPTKAVFLDRDGTINEEVSYLSSIEQLSIIPRTNDAIKLLNENGFKVIIITNQSGVSRGYFSEEQLKEINGHLIAELLTRGARIDGAYYCPHHPDGGCACRKPNTGNIERAAAEHDIDLAHSFMVGDTLRDIETGVNAGLRTVLVRTGYGAEEEKKMEEKHFRPDRVADDLFEAVQWIMGNS